MKDDVDELFDSDFAKADARVFDKVDDGKDCVLPQSKFVDLLETLGDIFHSEELAGHLQKVYPNESSSLDYFAFLSQYVDKEVYLESSEEAEFLVGWGYNVIMMHLQ